MNRIYKKIWNKVRGCYVAVSEAVGTGQSRGKAASVIVGVASAAVLLSPALSVAGNYTDMTFTGDGPDASGLYKGHGTHHTLNGTTTFIGKNGGAGALITADKGEVVNNGVVRAYGYGSSQDDTTSWGIRSTWGMYSNYDTEYLYGYGGSGNNSMGVGLAFSYDVRLSRLAPDWKVLHRS